jgi:hypothetical protein
LIEDGIPHTLVSLIYTADTRFFINIYGQWVLCREKWSQQTKFIATDYNDFKWKEDNQPLTCQDVAPTKIHKTYTVDMQLSRVDVNAAVGSGDCIGKKLSDMSGKINDASVIFWTLTCMTFAEKTVMLTLEDLNWDCIANISDGGSGILTVEWWTVHLKFLIEPEGWDKFFRAKVTSGTGAASAPGFYTLVHKGKAGNPAEPDAYLYETTDMSDILNS